MDIWGGDPWAEVEVTSISSGPAIEKVGSESSRYALNHFDANAEWGDVVRSDTNVWDNKYMSKEEPGEPAYCDSDDSVAEEPQFGELESLDESKQAEILPKDLQVHDVKAVPHQNLNSREDILQSLKITESELDAGAVEDVVTSIKHLVALSEPNSTDCVARPVSLSSATTATSETTSSHSACTSIEQGIPDTYPSTEFKEKSPKIGPDPLLELKATPGSEQSSYDVRTAIEEGDVETRSHRHMSSGPNFKVDLELIYDLFQPGKKSKCTNAQTRDLIDSTTTRKMWHRLSRPDTLRGIIQGDSIDNYVRVSWKVANVRKETVKIVSRWASEDTLRGKRTFVGRNRQTLGWNPSQASRSTISAQTQCMNKSDPSPLSPTRYSNVTRQLSLSITSPLDSVPLPQFSWSTSASVIAPPQSKSAAIPTSSNALAEDHRRDVPSISTSPNSQKYPTLSSDTLPDRPERSEEQLDVPQTAVEQFVVPPISSCQANSSTQRLPDFLDSAHDAQDASNLVTMGNGHAATTSFDDDDEDWGEMIHSLPPADPPALVQPSAMSSAGCEASTLPQLKIEVQKENRPPALLDVTSKQNIPKGPLSPTRRAAFDAARVTRALSSQRSIHSSPVVEPDPIQLNYQSTDLFQSSKVGLPLEIRPIASPASHDLTSQRQHVLYQDNVITPFQLQKEESFNHLQASTTGFSPTLPAHTQQLLEEPGMDKVRSFLANLPDLSYMFK